MPSHSADPGGDRGAAQPGGEVRLGRDEPHGRLTLGLLEHGAPAARRPAGARRRRGRPRPAIRVDVVDADDRPAERPARPSPHSSVAQSSVHARAGRRPARPRPGRAGRAARAAARSRATGSPPMPTLPSASSAVSQRPSPGHGVEDVAAQRRRAAVAGLADRLADDVDAEHDAAALGERGGQPAGAAADVEGRARRRARASPGRRRRPGGPTRRRRSRVTGESAHRGRPRAWRRRRKASSRTLPPGPGELAVAARRAAATASASATVSTSRSVGRRRRRRGRAPTSAARVSSYVVGVDIGTSCSARRAGRVAQREHPPAAVLGRAEHGVVVGRAAAATSAAASGVSCGVSMPTWTTGPPGRHVDVGVGEPLGEGAPPLAGDRPARRARADQLVAADGVGEVAGQREQAGVRAERRRGTRRGCRAARRRRGRRPRPCRRRRRAGSSPGRRPAPWRRPGRGVVGRVMTAPARSRGPRAAVPRTEPETLERVPAARGW